MNDDILWSKYGVVISPECGRFKTHEPHVISKGFLGIGVRKCGGFTHRHFWKLNPLTFGCATTKKFLFTVDWKCHCGESQSINRQGFYSELLGRPWIKK